MGDFLEDCISDVGVKKDYPAFQQTFCAHCRNRDCLHAKWSGDKFAARVAAQPERLFKPNQVGNTQNPKYAQLSDFIDNLREAMRLEIVDRKKDWEVPEIPILDGQDYSATPSATSVVDEAQKNAFVDETKNLMGGEFPIEVPTEPAAPSSPGPFRRSEDSSGKLGNVPTKNGIILQGGPVKPPTPSVPAIDPWEPPKKIATVAPGARIQLGGEPGKGK